MLKRRLFLRTEDEQVACGTALAAVARPGMCIYVRGELGAGKTTLTRGIARGLGHKGAVKSPTYTLVEPYEGLRLPLYHFDLYRLGEPEELEYLGVRDYFDSEALVIVEWPERGVGFLPPPDLSLSLRVLEQARELELIAASESGSAALQALDGARWEREALISSAG